MSLNANEVITNAIKTYAQNPPEFSTLKNALVTNTIADDIEKVINSNLIARDKDASQQFLFAESKRFLQYQSEADRQEQLNDEREAQDDMQIKKDSPDKIVKLERDIAMNMGKLEQLNLSSIEPTKEKHKIENEIGAIRNTISRLETEKISMQIRLNCTPEYNLTPQVNFGMGFDVHRGGRHHGGHHHGGHHHGSHIHTRPIIQTRQIREFNPVYSELKCQMLKIEGSISNFKNDKSKAQLNLQNIEAQIHEIDWSKREIKRQNEKMRSELNFLKLDEPLKLEERAKARAQREQERKARDVNLKAHSNTYAEFTSSAPSFQTRIETFHQSVLKCLSASTKPKLSQSCLEHRDRLSLSRNNLMKEVNKSLREEILVGLCKHINELPYADNEKQAVEKVCDYLQQHLRYRQDVDKYQSQIDSLKVSLSKKRLALSDNEQTILTTEDENKKQDSEILKLIDTVEKLKTDTKSQRSWRNGLGIAALLGVGLPIATLVFVGFNLPMLLIAAIPCLSFGVAALFKQRKASSLDKEIKSKEALLETKIVQTEKAEEKITRLREQDTPRLIAEIERIGIEIKNTENMRNYSNTYASDALNKAKNVNPDRLDPDNHVTSGFNFFSPSNANAYEDDDEYRPSASEF